MDLVGAWLRQLLRAGTAAALVPLAVVAALVVVVAGAGGLGGLGSLGQLVTGPEIPAAQRAEAADETSRVRDFALVAPPARGAVAPARAPTPTASPVEPERAAPAPPVRPPTRPPPVAAPPAPPPPPPPAAASPVPATAPEPLPTTAKERTDAVVDGLGETVVEVVTIIGKVIGAIGEIVKRILDVPPPRR